MSLFKLKQRKKATMPSSSVSPNEEDQCAICCETMQQDSVFTFSNCCQSKSCKTCIVKWIQKEEGIGQSAPTCPFCRMKQCNEEITILLGRPFQPHTARRSNENSSNDDGESSVDDLTQQWLEHHTKACPSCQARIQKFSTEDCDLMECLCGYRFCFDCGTQGGKCDCAPATHGFWDNVLNTHCDRSQAPLVADPQTLDLKSHLEKRTQQGEKRTRALQRARRLRIARNRPLNGLLNYLKQEKNPLTYDLVTHEIRRFVEGRTAYYQLPFRLRAVVGERQWDKALYELAVRRRAFGHAFGEDKEKASLSSATRSNNNCSNKEEPTDDATTITIGSSSNTIDEHNITESDASRHAEQPATMDSRYSPSADGAYLSPPPRQVRPLWKISPIPMAPRPYLPRPPNYPLCYSPLPSTWREPPQASRHFLHPHESPRSAIPTPHEFAPFRMYYQSPSYYPPPFLPHQHYSRPPAPNRFTYSDVLNRRTSNNALYPSEVGGDMLRN